MTYRLVFLYLLTELLLRTDVRLLDTDVTSCVYLRNGSVETCCHTETEVANQTSCLTQSLCAVCWLVACLLNVPATY